MVEDSTLLVLQRHTATIVERYLKHHRLAVPELPNLIGAVHRALSTLGKPAELSEERVPAVPVRRSVHRDYVVCLECGFHAKALKRHLGARHGLTADEYRIHWKLSESHAIIAPAYSEHRSAMAKQIGFGLRRTPASTPPKSPGADKVQVPAGEALDPVFAASLASVKRRRARATATKP